MTDLHTEDFPGFSQNYCGELLPPAGGSESYGCVFDSYDVDKTLLYVVSDLTAPLSSVRLSVCPSVPSPSLRPSACMSAHPFVCPFVRSFICLSFCPSVHRLSVLFPSVRSSVRPFLRLSVRLFVILSVCPSFHPCMSVRLSTLILVRSLSTCLSVRPSLRPSVCW